MNKILKLFVPSIYTAIIILLSHQSIQAQDYRGNNQFQSELAAGAAGYQRSCHGALDFLNDILSIIPEESKSSIFLRFNQRDVPHVALTCMMFKEFIDDNWVWYVYATRAHIVYEQGSPYDKNKDYKALVRYHCIPSFRDLNIFIKRGDCYTGMSFDGLGIGNLRLMEEIKSVEFLFPIPEEEKKNTKIITPSGNGLVVVGTQDAKNLDVFDRKAFCYKANSMDLLGPLEDVAATADYGIIQDVVSTNVDGSIIVGNVYNGCEVKDITAFQWTQEAGIKPLVPSKEYKWSTVKGLSADGAVTIGEVGLENGLRKAFRITEMGIEFLEDLEKDCAAEGLSGDGLVVAGYIKTEDGQNTFCRWTKGGLQLFDDYKKNDGCFHSIVNFDGSVMCINFSELSYESSIFRWTTERGLESIPELLGDILSPEWTLNNVKAMSPSGTVFFGEGMRIRQNIDGQTDYKSNVPWCAVIPRGNLF